MLRRDGVGSCGRRRSIFVSISTGEVFLSLLAGMTGSASVALAPGLTVKEIMSATGLDKRSAVDQLLYRMGKDGEIMRSARGRYALPQYALDALETSKKDIL
jgi:hypothetical protein